MKKKDFNNNNINKSLFLYSKKINFSHDRFIFSLIVFNIFLEKIYSLEVNSYIIIKFSILTKKNNIITNVDIFLNFFLQNYKSINFSNFFLQKIELYKEQSYDISFDSLEVEINLLNYNNRAIFYIELFSNSIFSPLIHLDDIYFKKNSIINKIKIIFKYFFNLNPYIVLFIDPYGFNTKGLSEIKIYPYFFKFKNFFA